MAEYIERKKFLSRLNYICNAYGVSKFLKEKFKKAIYDCTTADVVEVKHGKWLSLGLDDNDMEAVKCSECNIKRFGRSLYCSHCGAKMDLKEGAEE